jgi:hypothetical protein
LNERALVSLKRQWFIRYLLAHAWGWLEHIIPM